MNTTPQNTPFKQTEIGPIPQDWECNELKYYTSFISYGFTNPMPTVFEGVFMITANDVNGGRIKLEAARKTTENAYNTLLTDKSRPKKNDILLTKDGSLGRLALVGNEKICINQSVAVIRPSEKVDPLFFKYLLESTYYQKVMIENAGGSTIKHIYITVIDKMKMGFPPTKAEQTAIATALSDADALIGSLEKLIHKKRLLKQATMKHLLTPKEDWEVKKLGEIAEVKSGKRLPLGTSLTDKETLHPYIRIVDMYQGGVSVKDIKYVPEDVYTYIKNYRIYKEDIFISVAGTLGIVGRIPEVLDGANLTENANKLTDIKCDVDYLLVVLKSDLIQSKIESERTLGAQPKLALTRIRNFDIPIPPKAEQTRIATILSDMDAELLGLEAKLEKYRQLKQGMMQQLLTGKIRLV